MWHYKCRVFQLVSPSLLLPPAAAADKQCKPSLGLTQEGSKFDSQSIVGLVVWFACVLYSSIRTSSNSQVGKLTMSEKILVKDTGNSTFSSLFLKVARFVR